MTTASTPITMSSPLRALRLIAADIKLAHSVFALPFAVLAAFMAAENGPGPISGALSGGSRFGGQIGLIVLAMILARTVAMLANRLLDREIDRRNPRTAGRALPGGKLGARAALIVLLTCAVLFMLVCLAFGVLHENWWPTILGPPILLWLAVYALFKRFTWLCHLALGSALAISPLAAAIAVEPATVSPLSPAFQPALWLLAVMILFWVAGFDVIYALQDREVDIAQNLLSIPARFGFSGALRASRLMHLLAAAALIAVALADPRFGRLFAVGVGIVLALLIVEHATVARWGTKRIALAFFTLNGVISCLVGLLGILDLPAGT
ncbi:MAG: 4-hydroxybenzoate octaprenyltransferase [Planctomycetota bacterium]|nr:4-hydroxybenzoate octaprenyltransferase [Planctomycetota bacterium]